MSYEKIKEFLNKNGLILLTEKEFYINTYNKYKLKCPKGHEWEARLDSVIRKNRISRPSKGCPHCAEDNYIQQSLDIALSKLPKGHTIIDSYLRNSEITKINTRTYNIKCDNGHIYQKRNAEMENGCPKCNATTFIGQERVRLIFQEQFQLPFPSIRPDWLRNPATNKNLELDGYCEELKLAFEYQGRQHNSNDTEFGGDYQEQSKRDLLKQQLCAEHGVKLIIIEQPRYYGKEKFFQSVIDNCIAQGLDITLTEENLDFTIINDSNTAKQKFDSFSLFAETKGYKVLSSSLSTMDDDIEFECSKKHNFKLKASTFKTMLNTPKYRNEPCIYCHKGIEVDEKMVHIDTKHTNEKKGIEECEVLAHAIGYKILTTQYQSVNTLMEWECNHGHIFQKSFRQMTRNKTGKYCPECIALGNGKSVNNNPITTKEKSIISKSLSGEVRNIEWLKDFCKENNLTLTEEKYLGMDNHHNFSCAKEHNFTSTISNLVKKSKKGNSLCSHSECNGITVVDIDYCQDFAKNNQLECLSLDYKNVNTEMTWKCSNGHIFNKTFRQFQRNKTGRYCPVCG